MPKDPDRLAGSFQSENNGLMSGFLADENVFDRRTLLRLGTWGAATVGAVVLAVYVSNSSIALRRDQLAAFELIQQAQQIQWVAKESQNETRRLASTIETLNGDRDRLYSRVTMLEQGLDSMTGAIARQNLATLSPQAAAMAVMAATEPQAELQSAPPPTLSPVASASVKTQDKPTPETAPAEQAATTVASKTSPPAASPQSPPLVAAKSIMAPPDAAASKLVEPDKAAKVTPMVQDPEVVASLPPPAESAGSDASPAIGLTVAVHRTDFGVDVGGANSVGGLRALWRGLLKSRSNAPLAALRPIIVIRENNNGLGMQLRLVAGPLADAAAAAKICAGMMVNERPCQPTVFDGQRLVMNSDEPVVTTAEPALAKPAAGRRTGRWRGASRRVVVEEPKKPDPPTGLSAFFSRR
jgi:hypothetical protein